MSNVLISAARSRAALLLLVVAGGCSAIRGTIASVGEAPPSSPARAEMTPRNGLEVIGAMRRAHPSRALHSVAFTVISSDPETPARVSRARTTAMLPGRYRTVTLPSSRRTGTVRNRQRVAIFERGRRVVSRTRVDLATLLVYDLYAQGIDTTIQALDAAGVRYGVARRDRLDGERVWVVGAAEGDTTTPQFWVDAEHWRVVRIIQRDIRSANRIIDMRFAEFTDVLGVPLPTRVDVYRGDDWVERRTITNVAVNPSVPARAFDLTRWRDVASD